MKILRADLFAWDAAAVRLRAGRDGGGRGAIGGRAVGLATKAGTNCRSCIPEIAALLHDVQEFG